MSSNTPSRSDAKFRPADVDNLIANYNRPVEPDKKADLLAKLQVERLKLEATERSRRERSPEAQQDKERER